jgi:hypothetical protein
MVRLATIECANCHMVFGIPTSFERDRRDDHASFYCPAGHSQWFPHKSDKEKLAAQLERERQRLDAERTRSEYLRREVDRQKRKTAAQKGQLTKTKNRIKNGICPCCNRTFVDLGRHMSTQHPNYAEEAVTT